METEDSIHIVVVYPYAFGLRQAMREHWRLPGEDLFVQTGPDWLLLLLEHCTEEQREMIRMLIWRAWKVHNNIVHQSGQFSISDSVNFYIRYIHCCRSDKKIKALMQKENGGLTLGKKPQNEQRESILVHDNNIFWNPPTDGWIKINVDGACVEQTGEAGIGVVARDHKGGVLFTAWRVLFRCASAVEA